MKAPTARYRCACGASHPQLIRIVNVYVLECPEIVDDALHLVVPQKIGEVPYFRTGPRGSEKLMGPGPIEALMKAVLELGERVKELERLEQRAP